MGRFYDASKKLLLLKGALRLLHIPYVMHVVTPKALRFDDA